MRSKFISTTVFLLSATCILSVFSSGTYLPWSNGEYQLNLQGIRSDSPDSLRQAYIVILDIKAFPDINEQMKKKESPNLTRPDPSKEEAFEQLVKKRLTKYAKRELGIKAKEITQFYHAALFGMAIDIPTHKKKAFLAKAEAAKAVLSVEEDQEVRIIEPSGPQ